jgi:hypothetical protein
MQVNFYTLTFKKKILLSLFSIIAAFIMIDIALYYMVELKSTKQTFIDDKFSKIKHYHANQPQNKDIVFVGSSRTFFHIATHIFQEKGLQIYNFGISGAQFEDYPTIIKEIIKTAPKEVVISLNINRLYDKLEISDLPTLEEARYYYDIDKKMFFNALLQWTINLHQFLVHSQTIYYKIVALYEKFSPKKEQITHQKRREINYDKEVGCHVFDIQKIAGKYLTLKCSNGDGIRIGNHPLEVKKEEIKLTHFNPKSIAYIQKMVDKLSQHHIPITLLFQPILHNPYQYDLQQIKSQFKKADIIDLTNYTIADDYWADSGHLNNKGRKLYSQYLSDIIQNK